MDIKDITGAGEIGKEIINQIGGLVKEPIGNLTNPPTKTVGQRLGEIVDLIFTPVELLKIYKDHSVEKFRESLEREKENIPEDKRVMAPLNVVGPALEAAKYHIEDESLREMFVKLITGSMNSDITDLVHPSFVEVIKQLSPFDAQLLKTISDHSSRSQDTRNTIVNGINYVIAELRTVKREYTPNMKLKLPTTYHILKQSLKDFNFLNNVDNYEQLLETAAVSYENLIRLNLIEDIIDLGDIPAYRDFKKSPYMDQFVNNAQETIKKNANDENFTFELNYNWHVTKLTKYGITFCDIVMPKVPQKNGESEI